MNKFHYIIFPLLMVSFFCDAGKKPGKKNSRSPNRQRSGYIKPNTPPAAKTKKENDLPVALAIVPGNGEMSRIDTPMIPIKPQECRGKKKTKSQEGEDINTPGTKVAQEIESTDTVSRVLFPEEEKEVNKKSSRAADRRKRLAVLTAQNANHANNNEARPELKSSSLISAALPPIEAQGVIAPVELPEAETTDTFDKETFEKDLTAFFEAFKGLGQEPVKDNSLEETMAVKNIEAEDIDEIPQEIFESKDIEEEDSGLPTTLPLILADKVKDSSPVQRVEAEKIEETLSGSIVVDRGTRSEVGEADTTTEQFSAPSIKEDARKYFNDHSDEDESAETTETSYSDLEVDEEAGSESNIASQPLNDGNESATIAMHINPSVPEKAKEKIEAEEQERLKAQTLSILEVLEELEVLVPLVESTKLTQEDEPNQFLDYELVSDEASKTTREFLEYTDSDCIEQIDFPMDESSIDFYVNARSVNAVSKQLNNRNANIDTVEPVRPIIEKKATRDASVNFEEGEPEGANINDSIPLTRDQKSKRIEKRGHGVKAAILGITGITAITALVYKFVKKVSFQFRKNTPELEVENIE